MKTMQLESTMLKLLESNQKYLREKGKRVFYAVKIDDVPRPPKYSHKMPSKTGKTEYFRKFGSSSRVLSVPDAQP